MVVKYVQCPDSKVLIYRHEKRRKRRKSDVIDSLINRNCHRNAHYMNDFKCYSYILIYVFIVATIMILSLPTTIAMNQIDEIEMNENAINDVQPTIQMEQPNNNHARKIGKNYYRPVDTKALDSIVMTPLLSILLKMGLTTSREYNENAEWQRDDSIIQMKSCGMSGNCSKIPFKFTTIQNVSQKSVNSISQNGINKNNAKINTRTATAATSATSPPITNLNEQHFYSANHQMMVKNVSINRTKRNNQDAENEDEIHKMNFNPTMVLNDDDPNDFNYKLNVKRETRSVEMQPTQIHQPNKLQEKNMDKIEMIKNVRFPEAYDQQPTTLAETKVTFHRKQTINEFFDSTESQVGGVTESNGPIFDANRTTISIISSK